MNVLRKREDGISWVRTIGKPLVHRGINMSMIKFFSACQSAPSTLSQFHNGGGSVRNLPPQHGKPRRQIQWFSSSLRERSTELLHVVMKLLVRATLKGDGAVWGEED